MVTINSVATIVVETPEGSGRLHCAPADPPQAVLILGHGAGGGIDALDLSVLAERLPAHGVSVVRFEQPWRVAGKKVASPPAKLDAAWRAAVPQAVSTAAAGSAANTPVFFGGRSAGARVACRTASEFADSLDSSSSSSGGVAGVVCCAFPLHPPGRPDRSRASELLQAGTPRLVLQGERDPFGRTDEVRAATAEDAAVRVVTVPEADHSMRPAKTAGITSAQVQDLIADEVATFCLDR